MFLNGLFHPNQSKLMRLLTIGWMIGLLFIGWMRWDSFFYSGDFSLDFQDWAEVTGPRYAMLQDAAISGEFPLHGADTTAMRGITDRYLAIADVPSSPQFYLLKYLSIPIFIYVDTLLFYLIGFCGLLLFKKRYKLSLIAFTVLFLLFNFNGFIVSHLAIGHANWVAYFLLPYFLYLIFGLIEEERVGWKWILGLSLTLFVMLLQGGFHFYVWCLIFLGAIALFFPKLWKPVLLGGFFSGMTSLFRLLPPESILSSYKLEFFNGIPSLSDLVASLVLIRDPQNSLDLRNALNQLGYWELNFYIGLAGALFVIIFGVIVSIQAAKNSEKSPFLKLLFPALFLTILSLGDIFTLFQKLIPFPLFSGERVTSRMFIIPLLVLILIAVIQFQKFINSRKLEWHWQLASFLSVYLIYFELKQHLTLWRIRRLDGFVEIFPKVAFDPANHVLANHADPSYINLVIIGAIVTVLAFGFLIVMCVKRKEPL